MLLMIESVYGDVLLHGNRMEKTDLHEAFRELLRLVCEKDFSAAFRMRYGYETIPFDSNIQVDYTIDLDTHRIYKPKY